MSGRTPIAAGISPELDSFLAIDTFRQAQGYMTELLGTMSVGYAVEHRPEETARWQAWNERVVEPLKPIHRDSSILSFGIQLEAEGIAHDVAVNVGFDVDRASQTGVESAWETRSQVYNVGSRVEGARLLDPGSQVVKLAQELGHQIISTHVDEPVKVLGIRLGSHSRQADYVMPYDMEQRADERVNAAIRGSRVLAVTFDVRGRKGSYNDSLEKGIVVDPSAPISELPEHDQSLAQRLNPYAIMLGHVERMRETSKLDIAIGKAGGMVGMTMTEIVQKSQSDGGQDQIREKVQTEAENELEAVRARILLIDHLLEAITSSKKFEEEVARAAVR